MSDGKDFELIIKKNGFTKSACFSLFALVNEMQTGEVFYYDNTKKMRSLLVEPISLAFDPHSLGIKVYTWVLRGDDSDLSLNEIEVKQFNDLWTAVSPMLYKKFDLSVDRKSMMKFYGVVLDTLYTTLLSEDIEIICRGSEACSVLPTHQFLYN